MSAELERRYVGARARIDEAAIRDLMVADATRITAAGRLEGIEGSLESARSRGALEMSEETDLAVHLDGDSPIVTGVWDLAAGERRGHRCRMAVRHASGIATRATAPAQ